MTRPAHSDQLVRAGLPYEATAMGLLLFCCEKLAAVTPVAGDACRRMGAALVKLYRFIASLLMTRYAPVLV
jgi:hypothetical protein